MAVVKLKPREAECDLPVEINAAHAAAVKAIAQGTAHAIRAGELLLQAKTKFGHGQWALWQKANLSFSARTAQTYMQLAKLEPQKRNAVADLTLRRAVLKIQADQRADRILEERAAEREKWEKAERIGHCQSIEPTWPPAAECQPPTEEERVEDLMVRLCYEAEEQGISRDVLIEALCRAFDLVPRARGAVKRPRLP